MINYVVCEPLFILCAHVTIFCRCEQCLQNRYGVIKAEADPSTWVCPVCNENCNCSLCRKKVVCGLCLWLPNVQGMTPSPHPTGVVQATVVSLSFDYDIHVRANKVATFVVNCLLSSSNKKI